MRGKALVLAMLMCITSRAQADYQCDVKLRNDIVIAPEYVRVISPSGEIKISKQGDIKSNGRLFPIDAELRKKAADYQAELRRDLPWIEKEANHQIEISRQALDKIVTCKLGEKSRVRTRLVNLDLQLRKQMDRIIEHRGYDLIFHHQMLVKIHQQSEQLIQKAVGGILRDGFNEIGLNLANDNNHPLNTILSDIDELQQEVTSVWNTRQQEFQKFGQEVCNIAKFSENQYSDLMAGIKSP